MKPTDTSEKSLESIIVATQRIPMRLSASTRKAPFPEKALSGSKAVHWIFAPLRFVKSSEL